MNSRIEYLDGLRGIAILLVLFFHAYTRWEELVPYGATVAEFPLFKFGYLGVNLFFIISGFVILMSLENSRFFSFLVKRWLRLFPAMLVCSLLVFFTAPLFPERPNGEPQVIDLLAGLSFIAPHFWQKVGLDISSLEGAFWSLYVEVQFYIIAASIFFYAGSKRLVLCLLAFFLAWILLGIAVQHQIKLAEIPFTIASLLSFKYFGWFAAGSAFYLFAKEQNKNWFVFGCGCFVLSALTAANFNFWLSIPGIIVGAFFAAALVFQRLQEIISQRTLLLFGFISYPLYLIHENTMIALVIKMGEINSGTISLLYPLLALIPVVGIAYCVAQFVEPKLRKFLGRYLFNKYTKRA